MATTYMVILLCLFTFNICNCNLAEDELLGQARNLQDEIRKALDDLRTIISKSITDAYDAITADFTQFTIDVMDILKASEKTIKRQTTDSVSKITKLETILKATETPINCTLGKANEIRAIGPQLNEELSSCADKQIEESSTTIGSEMNKITNYTEVITTLEDEFEACGDGINAVPCLLVLRLNISEYRRTVPAEIKAITDDGAKLLHVVTQEVKLCGFIADANATYSCAEIVFNTLEECKS